MVLYIATLNIVFFSPWYPSVEVFADKDLNTEYIDLKASTKQYMKRSKSTPVWRTTLKCLHIKALEVVTIQECYTVFIQSFVTIHWPSIVEKINLLGF